jgi:hypothetical protein
MREQVSANIVNWCKRIELLVIQTLEAKKAWRIELGAK